MHLKQEQTAAQIKLFLKDLVSCKSTKENVKEKKNITDYLTHFLKRNRISYKLYEKNGNYTVLTSFHDKNFFNPTLCFHGHLDVVPGTENQYRLKEDRKRLYGRGVFDMKGSIAVFLAIIEQIVQNNKKPRIGFLFTTDEEVGGFDGTQLILKKGLTPQFAISGEPTDLKIGHQSKGVIWAKIQAYGRSAHAAYLHKGANALVALLKKINSLLSTYPIPKKQLWRTTVNLSAITTYNTTPNKVPDYAEVMLDIRTIPEDKKILQFFEKCADRKTKVEFIMKESPAFCSASNRHMLMLKKSIQAYSVDDDILVRKHGASDIRHFTQQKIPGVVFGLTGGGHHSEKEWIERDSLSKYYLVLSDFIKNF